MRGCVLAGIIAVLLGSAAYASAVNTQAGCRQVSLARGDVNSTTLEIYTPAAQPTEPVKTFQKTELPERFEVTDCDQPYLLWRRNGEPFFIVRTKIRPQALGQAVACRCPGSGGTSERDGAAPGFGVPLCPPRQCT